MIYHFKHVRTDTEKEQLYRLRFKVYCEEKKWFEAGTYEKMQEKDGYDDHSVFFTASVDSGEIIGCVRLIFHSPLTGLQICAHPEIARNATGLDLENCAEISRLIVASGYRRGGLMLGLIRILFRYIIEERSDLHYLLIGADPQFLKILCSLGFDFHQMGRPEFCYNDLIVVAKMNALEMDGHIREHNPPFHHWLHQDQFTMDSLDNFFRFVMKNNQALKAQPVG